MNSLQENKIQDYSAVALSNVSAAAISKSLFEEVLFSFFEKNLSKEISFLRDISIFQSLKQYELDYIHMQIISKVLEKNALVYKKGDLSQHLFIILEGEVEISYVVDDEEEKQIISNNSQKDNLLNSASPQKKKEYPVARLGKGSLFGESEILKNTERKSDVKVVSQKAHFYLLPKHVIIFKQNDFKQNKLIKQKQYVNILLEKQEFKQELEFQRQLKSQNRKKRLDQLKNIEKEGEIRKNQIKYQLIKLKQTSSTEDCFSSQKKLDQNGSYMLPVLPINYTSREISKSQENSLIQQNGLENQIIDSYQTVPQKSNYEIDGVKQAMNKFNQINFSDNRLYDFCQPKFGSINSVQIHPNKQLPKIQIMFDQISNSVDKRSYSYRNTQALQKERQFSQPTIDLSQLNRSQNQNSQLQFSSQAKIIEKDDILKQKEQVQKQNRSISLNNQMVAQNSQNQILRDINKNSQNINNHHQSQTIDYGYDMPFQNVFIKRQMSNQTKNQLNNTLNYNFLERWPQKQQQQNDSFKIINQKRNQSFDQIVFHQQHDQMQQQNFQRQSNQQFMSQKSGQVSYENSFEHQVINHQIPISSSPPPQFNDIEDEDDLSLQGEAQAYFKKVKKIPDRANAIPDSSPKIDPLRPKDKQIFVRKPIFNVVKKKEIKIDKDKDKLPQFFERSIQYQKSVMNILNYERQRAMIQINYENSLSKLNISKQIINQ